MEVRDEMAKKKGQQIVKEDLDAAQMLEETAQAVQKMAMLLAHRHKKISEWVAQATEEGEEMREDALFSLGILTGELDQIICVQKNFLEDYTRFRDAFMTNTKPKKEELH